MKPVVKDFAFLDCRLDDVWFGERSTKIAQLAFAGHIGPTPLVTVRDLITQTSSQKLAWVPGVGHSTIERIERILARHGWQMRRYDVDAVDMCLRPKLERA